MKELIHLKLTLNTEAFYCIENMKSSCPVFWVTKVLCMNKWNCYKKNGSWNKWNL